VQIVYTEIVKYLDLVLITLVDVHVFNGTVIKQALSH